MNSNDTPIKGRGKTGDGHAAASTSPNFRLALTLGGASCLVLVGSSLQMGELAYGSLVRENTWAISMTIRTLWAMLAELLGHLGLLEALRYWPLLLVMTGCGILVAGLRTHRIPAAGEGDGTEGSRG